MPMTWTRRWSASWKVKRTKLLTATEHAARRSRLKFFLRNVLFEHGSFINFPCCICCCHSHGFAFFLSSFPFAVKIYNSFFSAPFHFMFADFFLPRSMLNILKYIFTARDMRKKFPKTQQKKSIECIASSNNNTSEVNGIIYLSRHIRFYLRCETGNWRGEGEMNVSWKSNDGLRVTSFCVRMEIQFAARWKTCADQIETIKSNKSFDIKITFMFRLSEMFYALNWFAQKQAAFIIESKYARS